MTCCSECAYRWVLDNASRPAARYSLAALRRSRHAQSTSNLEDAVSSQIAASSCFNAPAQQKTNFVTFQRLVNVFGRDNVSSDAHLGHISDKVKLVFRPR